MKDFIYFFFDKLFTEKTNNIVCWALLAIAILLIVFQALRFTRLILIA